MRFLATALLTFSLAVDAAQPTDGAIASRNAQAAYVWKSTQIANTAELITLFCHACERADNPGEDIPLLSILRDTLGDGDATSDRITNVWLLSYKRPGIGKRLLSAVPFFYWRVGGARSTKPGGSLAPLLDMNSLQHSTASALTQNILQWTLLDPLSMEVRASTRAFRANAADEERLHLQEAISYLQQAPENAADAPLSQAELRRLIARLELRKTLLGGFVSERGAAAYGESAGIRVQEIRARNWELLREWADKTGLYFEPLRLAGTSNEYAALWTPRTGARSMSGTNLAPIWKLLSLKPPSLDELQHAGARQVYRRSVDDAGNLLGPGSLGGHEMELVPLGIYSLDYPKLPLLMVDFRNRHHLRWHAMEQRSINEVTAGVIGISHFTNWYYYVAADLYDFVASRHGSPMNQAERLDCYSQFHARIALDQELDPRLRAEIRERVNSLAMNPLEASPEAELQAALYNYENLEMRAQDGHLLALVDKDRRRELATWDSTKLGALRQEFFHLVTFGAYTARAKSSEDVVEQVRPMRRAQYQLDFLAGLARQDTPPEVQVDGERIAASVGTLEGLLPQVKSERFRTQAREVIARLGNNSEDSDLQALCGRALVAIHGLDEAEHSVALKAKAVRAPSSE